ncbi:MAG: response regulator [Gammaproteobacteria bacterium]|nr:response regulator [Gammaproteobacteria bacterium]
MGLRTKLILPAALGLIVFASVVHFVWVPAYLQHERENFETNELHVLQLITPTLIRFILAGDLATLHASLDDQMRHHEDHWKYLELYNEDGLLIYPIQATKQEKNADHIIITQKLDLYDEPYGHLTLTINWNHELEQKQKTIIQIEQLLLFVFSLIIIISSFLQGYLVNKPLLRLKKAALKLSNGDFTASLPEIKSDEIGQLTHAFDNMRNQLKESHTDLQQAVAIARFEEERQRAVINTMSDAVITINTKGLIESFNPAAEHIFGYDAAEVLDRNISILIPDTNAKQHNNLMQKDIASGDSKILSKTNEFKAKHKNGSIIDIEITVSEIKTEDTHIYSSIIRDITERKRHEEELRIAAISFDTHEGIVITDIDTNILRVNNAFTEITGYSEKEIIGQKPKILNSGKQDKNFYTDMWDKLNNKGRWSGEIWNKRKNGEIYPEWLAITAVKNEHGITTHYAANFLDISEQKNQQLQLEQKARELEQAKEAAEQASIAKSDFLANMSHEIRTPMNGVLGITQLLSETQLNKEQHEYVNVIQNSGKMLLNIINDILDFSKIEANKMDLEPITFNFEETAFSTIKMFDTKNKDLELLFNYSPDCPKHLIGDAGRLRQVLANIISNAIKFTSEGHVFLDINCEKTVNNRAQLLIKIEDTGIGIKPEAQDNLFAEFSQADTSTTRKYGGTGLGLAICKKIIHLMDGEIGIESTPGEGSTFWIRITLPYISHPPSIPRAGINNLRTLIVDDNEVNRRLLTDQLSKFGLQIESATNGKQALEKLHKQFAAGEPFQLALLDYMMPEMDGEILGKAILNDPDLKDLPLILLTSAGQRGDAQHFKNIGFTAYLTKPVNIDILLQTLEAVTGLKQQNEQHELITQYSFPDDSEITTQKQQFKGRVLLVEDDITNQKVANGTLKRYGLIPDIANNGLEAIELFSKNNYDLILMDCRMPEMDGYEATQHIRSLEQEKHTPIIAMTANIQPSDQEKCRQSGMDDFLGKPFHINDLLTLLTRWLPIDLSPDSIPEKLETTIKSDDLEPVNQTVLDNLYEAIKDDFEELITVFSSDLGSKISLINEALETRNYLEIQRLSHSLKSSSASLGASGLSILAETLENMAENNTDENMAGILDQLSTECDRVKTYLQNLIQ